MNLIELLVVMLPFLFSSLFWKFFFRDMGWIGMLLATVLGFGTWGLLLLLVNRATLRPSRNSREQ